MPKLQYVARTPGGRKEFVAVFSNPKRTVRFGTSSNYVLNKAKTKADRANYIKRHAVNEDFSNPLSAGALSRWILWGDSRSVNSNVRAFKKRFHL